jgi:hypothetical protein
VIDISFYLDRKLFKSKEKKISIKINDLMKSLSKKEEVSNEVATYEADLSLSPENTTHKSKPKPRIDMNSTKKSRNQQPQFLSYRYINDAGSPKARSPQSAIYSGKEREIPHCLGKNQKIYNKLRYLCIYLFNKIFSTTYHKSR